MQGTNTMRVPWNCFSLISNLLIFLPYISSFLLHRCTKAPFSIRELLSEERILVSPSSSWGSNCCCSLTSRSTSSSSSNNGRSLYWRYNVETSTFARSRVIIADDDDDDNNDTGDEGGIIDIQYQEGRTISRRKTLTHLVATATAVLVVSSSPFGTTNNNNNNLAMATVGTLPELKEANAILQGITVSVADESQQDSMIKFLVDGFLFQVLRQRTVGTVTDTVS
jgi:hypothetical protein